MGLIQAKLHRQEPTPVNAERGLAIEKSLHLAAALIYLYGVLFLLSDI
jgi:hypothetical protein